MTTFEMLVLVSHKGESEGKREGSRTLPRQTHKYYVQHPGECAILILQMKKTQG